MASLPYMPFFVDAYVLDAGHLTEEEHGAYLRLLMMAWSAPECRLPNDDAWLARRLSRPVETIVRLYRPVLAEFFQCDGHWLWQKRQKQEWLHAREIAAKQSRNAKSRWAKDKDTSGGNAMAMPTKPKPKDSESHTNTESHEPTAESDTALPPPDGGSAEPSVDAKTAFWREAKARIGGKSAGSLLGKWVRDYGEGAVFSAHCAAVRENPASYTDWMVGRLRHQAQPRASPGNGHRPGRGVSIIGAMSRVPDPPTRNDEREDEQEHQGIVGTIARLDPPRRGGVGG